MTTVSTTETEPAQEPFVRFAAFRGKVPLPWVTVLALAVRDGREPPAADPYPTLQERLVAYAAQ